MLSDLSPSLELTTNESAVADTCGACRRRLCDRRLSGLRLRRSETATRTEKRRVRATRRSEAPRPTGPGRSASSGLPVRGVPGRPESPDSGPESSESTSRFSASITARRSPPRVRGFGSLSGPSDFPTGSGECEWFGEKGSDASLSNPTATVSVASAPGDGRRTRRRRPGNHWGWRHPLLGGSRVPRLGSRRSGPQSLAVDFALTSAGLSFVPVAPGVRIPQLECPGVRRSAGRCSFCTQPKRPALRPPSSERRRPLDSPGPPISSRDQ